MNFPVFPEAWIALKGKKGQQYEAAIPRIASSDADFGSKLMATHA